jgi:hypothetical protein
MTADALGTAGGVVSAVDHRLGIGATVTPLAGSNLAVRTGVLPSAGWSTLITGTAATAPMTVAIAAFQAVTSRGTADGARMGPVQDVATTVNIAAAPGTNSRIDLIYVKENDADATVPSPDGSTGGVIGVVTGTAAVTPSKPALPVGGEEIGTVTVAAGATATNGTGVSNTARATVMRGGIVPVRSGDATVGAYDGQYRDNPSYGWVERWSASLGGWFRNAVPHAAKRVTMTATFTSTSSWLVPTWIDADPNDPGTTGMWASGSPGNLVAPVKGVYVASFGMQNVTHAEIRKNAGGSITGGTMVAGTNGNSTGMYVQATSGGFLMQVGDYVQALVYSSSSQTAGGNAYTPFFSLTLVDPL